MLNGDDGSRELKIRYQIRFDTGKERVFAVTLDYNTLSLITEPFKDPPDWTRLSHHQCPNCPLDEADSPRCPVAVNLADLIEFFSDEKSIEEVDVFIETEDRNITKCVQLQNVASSLMGIYMVASGCPILSRMRPLVQTHLPFQNWEETCFRMVSMYLMAQYFRMKAGKDTDWELARMHDFFQQVYEVNNAFFQRLDSVRHEEGEASLNAVSILNAGVSLTEMSIEADDLAHWERVFMTHWGD